MQLMLPGHQKHHQKVATTSSVAQSIVTSTKSTAATNKSNLKSVSFIAPSSQQQESKFKETTLLRKINLPKSVTVTKKFVTEPFRAPPPPASSTPGNCHLSSTDSNSSIKIMEHSYIRDNFRLSSEITGLAPARTILVRRPPQCPSCHTHPLEEHDMDDGNQVPVPTYNEIGTKESMNECARIAKYVRNSNSDDEDWESRINKFDWTETQRGIFDKVARILDDDHLGRLANASRQTEVMQRRCIVDKSASRMRSLLASIAWDSRITEWLHCLLMDNLPSTYMASYLDILQTLKTKLPLLMDKMLFSRPLNYSQEILAPVLTKQWEPDLNLKPRKLNHDAVIIAIPSMPYAGAIPNRLQKWYHYLATVARVIQVSVPMSSGYNSNTPLDTIAEQTVSLVRVKIQDLKLENPSRSIILVGFNAGGALALQVAMVESIAGVVCIGFAYNTMNGARGAPDDRILDIKVPIMFAIGQSAARTSPEEIESMREKMQSETSLVVVGSADDVLRVPKSRRKIENVTQAMVDNMVVDEVYEFIKKILTNPPGPRVPTPVTSIQFTKHTKAVAGGDGKSPITNRKRKQDAASDGDQVPTKTKYVGQVGRPRTRPLPGTPGKVAQKNNLGSTKAVQIKVPGASSNLSKEDFNIALQTIEIDGSDQDGSLNTSSESVQKLGTNLQISPIKTTIITPIQKQPTATAASIGGAGAKIKLIPSTQFIHLKSSMQSQSKIYTIKTPTMLNQTQAGTSGATNIGTIISSSPATTGQQQIFTLKTPTGQTTQFVTAASALPQQKYTVIKNPGGGATLQLAPSSTAVAAKNVPAVGSNLDMSSIIDMPILFADSEGNLTESVAQKRENVMKLPTKPSTSSNVGQLIISQKIIKEADPPAKPPITMQPPQLQQTNKSNKVVFINRNTMKPITTLPQSTAKYTKVVVSNPKAQSSTLLPRPATPFNNIGSPIVVGSGVKQVNLQGLKVTPMNIAGRPGGTLNVAGKPLQNFQIIGAPNSTIAPVTATAGADKPQVRNIVVKPGGIKQFPTNLKSQLLNRNLTVRKLLNIVPVSKAAMTGGQISFSTVPMTTTTTTQSMTPQFQVIESEDASSVSSGGSGLGTGIQTAPKIITLNPSNPSAAGYQGKTE